MDHINGELLQRIIEKRKLNHVSLAKRLDVSRNTIGNLVNERNPPSFKIMYSITRELNLTKAELLAVFFPNRKFPTNKK